MKNQKNTNTQTPATAPAITGKGRKANGQKITPKTSQVETTSKAPTAPKTEKKIKTSVQDRRNAFKELLKLGDKVKFETEKTAVNGINSATVTQNNAVMLTKVGEDEKATRVVEIWLHANRVDVAISKKLFDVVADNKKTVENYREKIDTTRKSSKYVVVLEDDKAASTFVNVFVNAL